MWNVLRAGGQVVLVGFLTALLVQISAMSTMAANFEGAASETKDSEYKNESSMDKQAGNKKGEMAPDLDPCNKDRAIKGEKDKRYKHKNEQKPKPTQDGEHGCKSRNVRAGDKSTAGTTCTSGKACVSPGASCVLGNTMHCRNVDHGGGNCSCDCNKP